MSSHKFSPGLIKFARFELNFKNRDEDKMPAKDMAAMAHEVGDLFLYLFMFCRVADLDPVTYILDKLEKIRKKYPVDYNDEGYR